MSDNLQPGRHLDADQLVAFAEGVLPEHDRLLVLAHTAECVRCREIAFLAQEPVPVETPAGERVPWWRGWLQPWVLGGAGALAASALLLGVFLWTRPEPAGTGPVTTALSRAPEQGPQRNSEQKSGRGPAKLDTPTPAAVRSAAPTAAASSTPPVAKEPLAESRVMGGLSLPAAKAQDNQPRSVAAPQTAAPVMAMSAPAPASASAPAMMAKATPQAQVARAPLQDKAAGTMSAVAPPPAAAAAASGAAQQTLAADASATTIQNAQVQQLPLYGRNQSPIRSAVAKPRAREAAAGPLHLQVEHGTGPNNGTARITGTVLDPTGATIPGAVVRLSQRSAAAVTQAVTDATGKFSLPPMPAGQYQAQVIAPGFAAVTQQVDLQSRDVAQVDAVLPIGAMSQTVEVSAANAVVVDTEGTTLAGFRGHDALPSGLPAAATVSSGERSVALDAAGVVFTRRTGKRWKQVKPRWVDKIVKLETGDVAPAPKKAGSAQFQITTVAGVVWVSTDGEHWVRR